MVLHSNGNLGVIANAYAVMQDGAPPGYFCWFINPIDYSYIYHKHP